MEWSRDYIGLAEFYDKNSSFRDKLACLDALRDSLPSDMKNLNTAWLAQDLPRGYASAWKIMNLIMNSSSLSEFWLKAEVAGKSFSGPELRYLSVLLLIYRFQWLYEWQKSDEAGMDASAGFKLSRFLSEYAEELR